MELALVFIIGVSIGVVIALLVLKTYFIGTLRVDQSDPDEPYMFLELNKGVSQISSKRHVVLRVKLENYIPHK